MRDHANAPLRRLKPEPTESLAEQVAVAVAGVLAASAVLAMAYGVYRLILALCT